MSDTPATLDYDATGLLCPLPVLRANRKLRELPVGGLLTVRATDPAAEADFPAYCRQTGHELSSLRAAKARYWSSSFWKR